MSTAWLIRLFVGFSILSVVAVCAAPQSNAFLVFAAPQYFFWGRCAERLQTKRKLDELFLGK